jgi:hypothetical protein
VLRTLSGDQRREAQRQVEVEGPALVFRDFSGERVAAIESAVQLDAVRSTAPARLD